MLHLVLMAALAAAPQTQGLEVRQETLKSGVHVRSVVLTVHGKFGRKPRPLVEADITIDGTKIESVGLR